MDFEETSSQSALNFWSKAMPGFVDSKKDAWEKSDFVLVDDEKILKDQYCLLKKDEKREIREIREMQAAKTTLRAIKQLKDLKN